MEAHFINFDDPIDDISTTLPITTTFNSAKIIDTVVSINSSYDRSRRVIDNDNDSVGDANLADSIFTLSMSIMFLVILR